MNRIWMPLYVADYLADTAHLSTTEHGAYLLLIMHYWTKCGLPSDEEAIRRITRLNPRQWSHSRDLLRSLFSTEWRHKRIDEELAKSLEKSRVNSANAQRSHKSRRANASDSQVRSHTQSQSQSESKIPEANASGADDPRKRLFNDGLQKLAKMTGKGPDSCRSFVARCLKAADDDAITVLGLIEDAERNNVADPSSWITARLPNQKHGAANVKPRSAIIQAADDLRRKIASFDGPARSEDDTRSRASPATTRLLSNG